MIELIQQRPDSYTASNPGRILFPPSPLNAVGALLKRDRGSCRGIADEIRSYEFTS